MNPFRPKRRMNLPYPDELFSLVDEIEIDNKPIIKPPRRMNRISLVLGFFVLTTFLSALVFAYKIYTSGTQSKAPHPYTFFEIRAINNNGNPVAGASVTVGEGIKGITDSFGEWRRYMRVAPGGRLKIQITKQIENDKFTAQKIITVPRTNTTEEAEVKLTIQLKEMGAETNPEEAGKDKSSIENEDGSIGKKDRESVKDKAETAAKEEKKGLKNEEDGMEEPDESLDSSTIVGSQEESDLSGSELDSIQISLKEPDGVSLSSSQQKEFTTLKLKILPVLLQNASTLGLRQDGQSKLKMQLSYVPIPLGEGVIRADAEWQERSLPQKTSFLKSFSQTPNKTSISILNTLKIHIPKKYDIYRDGDEWYVIQPTKAKLFWELKGDEILYDPDNRKFTIVRDLSSEDARKMRLDTSSEEPCKNMNPSKICKLYWGSPEKIFRSYSWQPLSIKILGSLPGDTDIFVSGYLVRKISPEIYTYWGVPNTSHNLTVLRENILVFRDRIKDTTPVIPFITLPKNNMARSGSAAFGNEN
ncbi:MAG: hypothetical protein HQK54_04500 [Oligoflexales bacterium]|nr:hypothetical protein [Oligoflexales bacterium]